MNYIILNDVCFLGHFRFSSQLCDGLDVCYGLWDKYLGGVGREEQEWRWRERASREGVRMREKINPRQNNYDGSNYITE